MSKPVLKKLLAPKVRKSLDLREKNNFTIKTEFIFLIKLALIYFQISSKFSCISFKLGLASTKADHIGVINAEVAIPGVRREGQGESGPLVESVRHQDPLQVVAAALDVGGQAVPQ